MFRETDLFPPTARGMNEENIKRVLILIHYIVKGRLLFKFPYKRNQNLWVTLPCEVSKHFPVKL